jgi:exosortase D (VPLPA-CTERM-specific)
MTTSTLDAPEASTASSSPNGLILLALFAVACGLLGVIFYDGLDLMVKWWERDEYSHGYMIPMVAVYLVWQKQHQLAAATGRGAWAGTLLVALSLFVFLMGELSALYTVIQYAFLLCLAAVMLSFFGWRSVPVLWIPMAYLIFMIPLPNFLYNNLSSELQLISSQLGVYVIRLFDISVYLQGNVIDLGVYKLQVVEACSGLRYLFPLMSFGFLIAVLYKGPFWQRAVLFLSTMPITVLMNSFRIGVIGVTVEYWGIEMAEGFLHDFEGWVIFMGCLGVLFVEMWIFHVFTKDKKNLWDRVDLDMPEETIALSDLKLSWSNQKPFLAALVLLIGAVAGLSSLQSREELKPEREQFNTFPLYHNGWSGREAKMEDEIRETLKLTDYIKADYTQGYGSLPVNFYVAYYDSQRKGASIHSPRSCIPGDGWQITGMKEKVIEGVTNMSGEPLKVVRMIISKGEASQVVFFWLEQRGRNILNEYAAKWYLFEDSMTMNRTDGALVRVTVPVIDKTKLAESEALATQFVQDFYGLLPNYLPGK